MIYITLLLKTEMINKLGLINMKTIILILMISFLIIISEDKMIM